MKKSVTFDWQDWQTITIYFPNGKQSEVGVQNIYRNCDMKYTRSNKIPVQTQKLMKFANGIAYVAGDNYIKNDAGNKTQFHHRFFTQFIEQYEVPAKRLLLLIRGFIYRTKIQPVEKWVERLARGHGKGKYNWQIIDQLNSDKDLITEFEADGLEHLVPVMLMYNMSKRISGNDIPDSPTSTKNMKQYYGKGMWKWFCNNSMTKNCLVYKKTTNTLRFLKRENIRYLKNYPSGVLKYWSNFAARASYDEYNGVVKEIMDSYSFKSSNCDSAIRDLNIVKDTKYMASQLNISTDNFHKLSFNRIRQLHEEYTEQLALLKDPNSTVVIEWLHDEFEDILEGSVTKEKKEYKWKIYDRKVDIKREGRDMKHCVGMYGDRVDKGNYLVISIRNSEDNKLSTVGLYRSEIFNGWKVQQHYGPCNKQPSKVEKDVCQYIVKQLNKDCPERVEFITDNEDIGEVEVV